MVRRIRVGFRMNPRVFFYAGIICTVFVLGTLVNAPNYNNVSFSDGSRIDNPNAAPASTIYRIYLYSLTPNESRHGDTVYLAGYCEQYVSGVGYVAASGKTVYAVINDNDYPGMSDVCNSTGNFTIPIKVPSDLNIYNLTKITAKVDDPVYGTNCLNITYLDVDSPLIIEPDTVTDPAIPYDSRPTPGFVNYRISGTLYLDNGSIYTGPSITLNFSFADGSYTDSIFVNPDGTYEFYTWVPTYTDFYTISFDGNDDLLGFSINRRFLKMDGVTFDFTGTEASEYQNQTLTIVGRVFWTGHPEYPLRNAIVTVEFAGYSENISTDVDGRFSALIQVPDTVQGDVPLTARLIYYNGNPVYRNDFTGSFTVNVRVPNPFDPASPNSIPYPVIIGGIIVAAAVVGIVMFQKWRLKTAEEKWKSLNLREIGDKLTVVRILFDSGRKKEAVVYLFKLFTELMALKYNFQKKPSQTSKSYAITLVREYGHDPEDIYPFIETIEKLVYGRRTFSREEFEGILKQFYKVYSEIAPEQYVQQSHPPAV